MFAHTLLMHNEPVEKRFTKNHALQAAAFFIFKNFPEPYFNFWLFINQFIVVFALKPSVVYFQALAALYGAYLSVIHQLFDVVYQAKQQPLALNFGFSAKAKPV